MSETETDTGTPVFSRSLLVQGPADMLDLLAEAFLIQPRNLVQTDSNSDFGFLERREPALSYSMIAGDFSLAMDIYLWSVTEAAFRDELRDLSTKGVASAMPDDSSSNPLDFVLFVDGEERRAQVDEDETFDETFIIGQPELRKRLRALSATV